MFPFQNNQNKFESVIRNVSIKTRRVLQCHLFSMNWKVPEYLKYKTMLNKTNINFCYGSII